MQDNEKKPALRFKGFTDPWEQRKLGEMVDVCSGMDYKHLSEGDIPVYGTGGYMLSVNKALSYDRNAVGIGRKGTIDKPYILKAPFWTVDTLFYAIPKDSKNIDFTFDVFQKVDWKKKDESTGVPSLSKIAINETSISTPSKLEQERIGSFFRNLDTLITLHQRKYEKLVNIKKSMLDKMFPQNGVSVPEIRFKGFTDPWEQRKLGDITVELSEYATQELGLPLLTSSRSGLMYQDEYRDSRTTKSTETLFSVVPVGTCTYRHMSDDDVFHMNINTLEKGLVSREYPVFEASKGNNLEFLVQHINSSEEFKAFCAEQKKGGTRTRLYYNTLCQFTVRVPALKEQAQISQCLKKLDTLITLHQRKLEKLQNIKKSCLEKMFV